jgi:hypothetical protein
MPRGGAAELAKAVLDAVHDPARLQLIAQRAHARWRALYTLDRYQSEVCEALEGAAGSRRSVRASASA